MFRKASFDRFMFQKNISLYKARAALYSWKVCLVNALFWEGVSDGHR